MAFIARIKTLAGGKKTLPTIASATTTNVPDGDNAFYISGSATITALVVPTSLRNREVTFIGAASAAVVFTHTASATTTNQMILGSGNITLGAGHVLVLFCKENGVWIVKSHSTGTGGSDGGGDSTGVASGSTTTIPDSANTHLITGTATITVLTATAVTQFRRITLIGGSSASVTFTNTNSPASGQMYLLGANVVLLEQDMIVLIQQPDGSFFLEVTTAA